MVLGKRIGKTSKKAFVFLVAMVTMLAAVLPVSGEGNVTVPAVVAKAATGTTYKYGKYSAKAGRADVLLNGTRYRTAVEYSRLGTVNRFTVGELGDDGDQSLSFEIADSCIKADKTYAIKSFKSSKVSVNFTAEGFPGLSTVTTGKWSKYGKYFDKVSLKFVEADKKGITTIYFSVKFHNAKNEVFTAAGFFAYELDIEEDAGDTGNGTDNGNTGNNTNTGDGGSGQKPASDEKVYTYGDFNTVEGSADVIYNGEHYLVNASCTNSDTSQWKFKIHGFGNGWQIQYDIEPYQLGENKSIGTDTFLQEVYTGVYAYNFPLHDKDMLSVSPFYLYSNASYFDEISFMPVSMPESGVMTAYFTLKFSDGQDSYSFEGFMAVCPGKTYGWSAASLENKELQASTAGRTYKVKGSTRMYETEEGKADVYYDGERYLADASFTSSGYMYDFTVSGFDSDKKLSFSVHKNYLAEYLAVVEGYFFKYSDANFFAFRFPLKDSGKDYVYPKTLYGNTGYFDRINLTPVKMDDGDVTTAYFSVVFRDESGNSHTVSGLLAAALNKKYKESSENNSTGNNESGNSGSSGNGGGSGSSGSTSLNLCTACYGTGKCGICHGTRTCQSCMGRGGMSYNTWGQGGSGWVECAGCHGSKKCKYCSGTGKCSTCNGTGKR